MVDKILHVADKSNMPLSLLQFITLLINKHED